ncbi:Putative SOS response-associated peptidase YedK [Actinacidiphila yanglinensis]|uniref:Abasic site processing protein n=1 Tax=Actinacidiphila yanglinensis TaxID=310779 RepID=A0A1H6D6L0_9ACTN|nr:SOS response-associated peptidase [Actinacidiphila yanglinensis]SEG80724.1 Putative SOS response-associated peptidase YedK [Actinacidiphila yanglinensis]
MCGRYVAARSAEDLAAAFDAPLRAGEQELPPSWNVAPTDQVWGVVERAPEEGAPPVRQLRPLRWGLVPSWAKSLREGARMINARAETVHEKPAFRKAFTSRRCLLPADGYYEWESVPAGEHGKAAKKPYYLHPADGSVLAMAGLYEFWRDPELPPDEREWVVSCTIITTDATDSSGRVHPRMPLTIAPEHYEEWLDPGNRNVHDLRELLALPADGDLDLRAVPPTVNSVRNDGPGLIAEV